MIMHKNDIINYSVAATLRDGSSVTIRAIRHDDIALIADALSRVSPASLYQRTFSARRIFSDKELERLVNIDFERIVALVAIMQDAGRDMIVGEGRYVRTDGPTGSSAEVAFLVADELQGIGIGSLIFRYLAAIARPAGVMRFEAELLGWNERMMRLFMRSGFPIARKSSGATIHVTIELNTAP